MHLDRKAFPKYFVLQSLHTARPSTTTCATKLAQSTFQVLLCTTKLAQSTSQYYFVEGSLEVKLPTIWTDEKQRWKESERRKE